MKVLGIFTDVAEIVCVDHDTCALGLADLPKLLNQREVAEEVQVIVIVAHKICVDLVAHLQFQLTGGGARNDDLQLVGIFRIIGYLSLLERGSQEPPLPRVGKAAHVDALEIIPGLEDSRNRRLQGIVGDIGKRVEQPAQ